ncbi:MAG: hypothetical protein ABIJ15_04010 [bacterium]
MKKTLNYLLFHREFNLSDVLKNQLKVFGIIAISIFTVLFLRSFLFFSWKEFYGFAFSIYVLVFSIGWAVVWLAQINNLNLFEKIVFSCLIGYPLTTALFFVLSGIGFEMGYFAICGLAVVSHMYILIGALKKKNVVISHKIKEVDFMLLLLICLVIIINAHDLQYFLVESPFKFIYTQYHDHLIHLSFVQEILKNCPPQQNPCLAGYPFPVYHVFPDVFIAVMAKFSKIDMFQIYHIFLPIFRDILFASSLFILIRRLTTSTVMGYVAIIMFYLYFFTNGQVTIIGNDNAGLLKYLFHNPPAYAGFLIYMGFFLSLNFFDRQKRIVFLYMAAFFSIVMFQFKANFFIVIFPSFAVIIGLVHIYKQYFYKDLSYLYGVPSAFSRKNHKQKSEIYNRGYLYCFLFIVCFGIIFIFYSMQSPVVAKIGIKYGLYADHVYSQYFITGKILHLVGRLPVDIRRIVVIFIQFFIRMPGIYFPFILVYIVKKIRSKTLNFLDYSIFMGWLGVIFVSLFLIQEDAGRFTSWNVAGHSATIVSLFSVILGISGFNLFYKKIKVLLGTKTFFYQKSLFVTCTIMFFNYIFPRSLLIAEKRNPINVSHVQKFNKDQYLAYCFLRDKTPVNSVIISNRQKGHIFSAFTGRRAFFESVWTMSVIYKSETDKRDEVFRQLSKIKDIGLAKKIFRKYNINYLLYYKSGLSDFPFRSELKPVFATSSITVFEVNSNILK